MFIAMGFEAVEVPDDFLKPDYVFKRERIRRIWRKSKLQIKEFARVYGFTYAQVAAWITERSNKPSNNPCPACRVKLAFSEASLFSGK